MLHVVLTLLLLISSATRAAPQASLERDLKPYLAQYGLPALAVAVVKNGTTVAAGAVGTRRTGTSIPVTLNDRFHLGSDTKAMTALLAAMYVESGQLRWNSTPGEVFPELAAKMDTGFRNITLEQLLSHTSGMPADNEAFGDLLARTAQQDGNLDELRYYMLREWSTLPLEAPPDSRFAYSNMGYTIAGAMIERAAGKSWDELVIERVFAPLGLKTAGLGPQSHLGRIDAPLGHAVVDGKIKAFLAGPSGDNPTVIGPAGISHMSVLDFARWAAWNAGEGKRGPHLVKPDTLKKLHTAVIAMPIKKDAAPGTPAHGQYALGWGVVEIAWADHPLIYHGGSNEKNLAHIWLDPQQDFAMVIVTNIGGRQADQALRELAPMLYRKYARSTRPLRRER